MATDNITAARGGGSGVCKPIYFQMWCFGVGALLGVLGSSRAFFRSDRIGAMHFGEVSAHIDGHKQNTKNKIYKTIKNAIETQS